MLLGTKCFIRVAKPSIQFGKRDVRSGQSLHDLANDHAFVRVRMINEPVLFKATGCYSDEHLAMAIDDKDAGPGGLEKLLILSILANGADG